MNETSDIKHLSLHALTRRFNGIRNEELKIKALESITLQDIIDNRREVIKARR